MLGPHFGQERTLQPEAARRVCEQFAASRGWRGTVIEIGAPSGNFVLKAHETNPIVFISGRVGIIPFESMLNDMIA